MLHMPRENGIVWADRFWRFGSAVRRHRTAVARRGHMAIFAPDLEPAGWRDRRRLPDGRSNCRWGWNTATEDGAPGFRRSLHRVFVFLAGLHPRGYCRTHHLCALRELLRTIFVALRSGCSARGD